MIRVLDNIALTSWWLGWRKLPLKLIRWKYQQAEVGDVGIHCCMKGGVELTALEVLL